MIELLFKIKKASYQSGEAALTNTTGELNSGDILCVIGPNGSGKSTFLKALLGMIDVQGNIVFSGDSKSNNDFSYVTQNEDIDRNFPITVKEFIALGGIGLDRNLFKTNIDLFIKKIKLEDLQDRNISNLSGGQFKRALIARALIRDPECLLLDEPLNEVDIPTEEIILQIVKELSLKGKIIIITTHDLDFAKRISNKVLLLNKTQIAFGDTKTILNKENLSKTFGNNMILEVEGDVKFNDHHGHKH